MPFKPFKDFLSAKTPLEQDSSGLEATHSARLAVAALLWEMAHIDGSIDKEEFNAVIKALDHEFHLMDSDAVELVDIVDFLRRTNQQLERFIEEINASYNREQRSHLVDLLWQIAESDGRIDRYEREFVQLIRNKLSL